MLRVLCAWRISFLGNILLLFVLASELGGSVIESMASLFSWLIMTKNPLQAVLELHGYPYPYMAKDLEKPVVGESDTTVGGEGEGPSVGDKSNGAVSNEKEDESDPVLDAPYYCLSEAGEGAMAWEATLQSMFPGVKSFWNRLLNDGRSQRLGEKVISTSIFNCSCDFIANCASLHFFVADAEMFRFHVPTRKYGCHYNRCN